MNDGYRHAKRTIPSESNKLIGIVIPCAELVIFAWKNRPDYLQPNLGLEASILAVHIRSIYRDMLVHAQRSKKLALETESTSSAKEVA